MQTLTFLYFMFKNIPINSIFSRNRPYRGYVAFYKKIFLSKRLNLFKNIKMKNIFKNYILISTLISIIFITINMLIYYGIIQINTPSIKKYPIRGIDISWRQGKIDWQSIHRQSISFVFMKATEGGDHKDRQFDKNWEEARAAGLYAGAYHFFRAETDGAAQAVNFMINVPKTTDSLPPVVDFECSPKKHGANAETVLARLNVMLYLLESYYGKRPIIYATKESYDFFLKGRYDHPFWSRDIFFEPDFPQKNGWLFWQYSNRGRLDGINGDERFVDLNVFNGSVDDFQKLME